MLEKVGHILFLQKLGKNAKNFDAVIKAGGCFTDENKICWKCLIILFIVKWLYSVGIKTNTLL